MVDSDNERGFTYLNLSKIYLSNPHKGQGDSLPLLAKTLSVSLELRVSTHVSVLNSYTLNSSGGTSITTFKSICGI